MLENSRITADDVFITEAKATTARTIPVPTVVKNLPNGLSTIALNTLVTTVESSSNEVTTGLIPSPRAIKLV